MPEQVQYPHPPLPDTPGVAPSTAASPGLLPVEAITVLRGLLDNLEAAVPPPPETVPAPQMADPSAQIGTGPVSALAGAMTDGLANVPQVIVAQAESRLRSSRLWTMIGTVATLALQNSAGLNLSPAAQLGIAAVAAIYIAARSCKG